MVEIFIIIFFHIGFIGNFLLIFVIIFNEKKKRKANEYLRLTIISVQVIPNLQVIIHHIENYFCTILWCSAIKQIVFKNSGETDILFQTVRAPLRFHFFFFYI